MKVLMIIVTAFVISATLVYRAGMTAQGRFLLSISGVIEPRGCNVVNEYIENSSGKIRVMRYYPAGKTTPPNVEMVIHGLSHHGYRHPNVDTFSMSLCTSLEREVVVPDIRSLTGYRIDVDSGIREIREAYLTIRSEYPGRVRIYSFCVGSHLALRFLQKLPQGSEPSSLFLYGPFADGGKFVAFINEGRGDIIGKLVLAFNSIHFNEDERKTIGGFLETSNPGHTAEEEVKHRIGHDLYRRISDTKIINTSIEKSIVRLNDFTPGAMSTRIFIMHSVGDNIVHPRLGEETSGLLEKRGFSVNFIMPGIGDHGSAPQGFRALSSAAGDIYGMYMFFGELFNN